MFGKRVTETVDPSDFRAHDRRAVQGLKVYVDKQQVEVLDYSDGGVRVSSMNPLPRVTVIEIFRGDKLLRSVAAVTAWSRGGQTGYAFRPKLKLTTVAPVSKDDYKEKQADQNTTGGMTGSALKNRLKL